MDLVTTIAKLALSGTPGYLVLAIAGLVFQWREIRAQSKATASLLEKSTVSVAALSGTVAGLTTSIEAANRANEARLDTLKNLAASAEAQQRLMEFLLDQLQRLRA